MIVMKPQAGGLDARRLTRIDDWMQRWVDAGKLPGMLVGIMRHERLVYLSSAGMRDVEGQLPVEEDTVYRIYSMTKPITTVAAMMLYEEGAFQLDDPLYEFLPAFADTRVFISGDAADYQTESLERPVTVHDLMTHTSGLTYGFQNETAVDALYRDHEVEFNANLAPLDVLCDRAAAMPLLFQPGSRWNYGVSTDVLGRLVEIWSGQSLGQFFAERIFAPLGMHDTGFSVPAVSLPRFAACYIPNEDSSLKRQDSNGPESPFANAPVTYSGGGGLVSTARDYLRFCQCLQRGGELNGERLLGRKTVDLMFMNHLPGDMASMGQARFSEMPFTGIGFGLGGAIMLDPAKAKVAGSAGEFAWGGMASTAFWIDRAEAMSVVLMTQLIPSSTYPIRRQLRALAYQAITD